MSLILDSCYPSDVCSSGYFSDELKNIYYFFYDWFVIGRVRGSYPWSLLLRLWFQMHKMACILDILGFEFLNSGRKRRRVVHLYVQSIVWPWMTRPALFPPSLITHLLLRAKSSWSCFSSSRRFSTSVQQCRKASVQDAPSVMYSLRVWQVYDRGDSLMPSKQHSRCSSLS